MPSDSEKDPSVSGRWLVHYWCSNEAGELQTTGGRWFDAAPTDEQIDGLFNEIAGGNIGWAHIAIITGRKAPGGAHASAPGTSSPLSPP